MSRRCQLALAPCLALAVSACGPVLDANPTTPGVRAMFDPTTGTVALPNDLLVDPTTARLAVPSQAGDSSLTSEIKQNLSDANGWLTGMAITLPFDGALKEDSVTTESVILVDLGLATEPLAAERLAPDSYFAAFNKTRVPAAAKPFPVVIRTKSPAVGESPADFKQGHRYAAIVTDAVKGADGLPALSHAGYAYLKSTTPLVDQFGHSATLLPDGDSKTLEFARSRFYSPVFDLLEAKGIVKREHALAFTVFTTQAGARPAFNPTLVGTILPSPIDKVNKDGSLASVNATPDTKPEVRFDLPYNVGTAKAGTHLFKIGTTWTPVEFAAETTETPDAKNLYPLRIVPAALLEPATQYVVVVTSELKSNAGTETLPSSFFALVRGKSALIDKSTTPVTLNSPFVDLTLDVLILLGKDPSTATEKEWQTAFTLLVQNLDGLDTMRKSYKDYFDAAEAQQGITRRDTVALWTFTTASK